MRLLNIIIIIIKYLSHITIHYHLGCPLFVQADNQKAYSSNCTWHVLLKETCLAEEGELGKPQEWG